MSIKKVTLSDGRVLKVKTEEGATNEDITNAVNQFLTTEASPKQDVGFGQIATGIGVEVGAGIGGKYAGTAIGTAIAPGIGTAVGYIVGSIGSGIAGSIAAQNLEGRDTVSWGRAISAGLINLIPVAGTKAITAGTKGIVSSAAKRGGIMGLKEGVLSGAAEAQLTSIVDEGRLEGFATTAAYAGLGGVFGGGLGTLAGSLARKSKGKTPSEIDKMISFDEIRKDEIVAGSMQGYTKNGKPIKKKIKEEVERSRENIIQEEAGKNVFNVTIPKKNFISNFYDRLGTGFKNALAGTIPTLAVGRQVSDIGLTYKQAIRQAEDLGSKVDNAVKRLSTLNPEAESKIAMYLQGRRELYADPELQKIKPLLDQYKDVVKQHQKRMIYYLNGDKINTLPAKEREKLMRKIEKSIDQGDYLTREYRLFTDANFKLDPKKRLKARNEMARNLLKRNKKKPLTFEEASSRAEKHLQKLEANSAAVKGLDPDGNFIPNAVNGSFRARSLDVNTNKDLMDYMGIVGDTGERARGTLTRLTKMTARLDAENNIENVLLQLGLASKTPRGNMTQPLQTRLKRAGDASVDNAIYTSADIQIGVNQLYGSNIVDKSQNFAIDFMDKIWNTSIGGSKATKVLFNVPSYAVNFFGATSSMVQQGVNPFNIIGSPGLKVALSDFDFFRPEKMSKEVLEDIKDAERFGIKGANIFASDIRDNLDRGFKFIDEGTIDAVAKAYSVPDTLGRYLIWKSTQRKLKKFYNGASVINEIGADAYEDRIKQAAALLTNDTFQNYSKLNPVVRWATRYGIMPQFASFTAEFARNQFNMGKQIKNLFGGTYAAELGINLGKANTREMAAEGAKRVAATGIVFGGYFAAEKSLENNYGNMTDEKKVALRESILPDWDKDSPIIAEISDDGKKYKYANSSYLLPQSLLLQSFRNGFDGDDVTSVSNFLMKEFVGDGTFVGKEIYSALANRDLDTGKRISYNEGAKKHRDLIANAVESMFKPGTAREVDKFLKAYRNVGDYSMNEVTARQFGYRVNKGDMERSASFKARGTYENAQGAKSNYNTLVKYNKGEYTKETVDAIYQQNNETYRSTMNQMIKHKNNFFTLGFDKDQIIEIFRKARVSNKDILSIMTNNPSDIPRVPTTSTEDIVNSLNLDLDDSSNKNLKSIAKSLYENFNPNDAKKYLNYVRRYQKKSTFTPEERLIFSMSNADKRQYLIDTGKINKSKYIEDMVRKGVFSREFYRSLLLQQ